MLKAQYPQADIFGQDVNQAWLEWCADNLGVNVILSKAHIQSVTVERESYDLVWVGSVFTHIPEKSFDYLLDVLVGGLKQSGILIFTTAGELVRASFDVNNEKLLAVKDAKKAVLGYDENGYGFALYSGGTYSDWGRAMVTFASVQEKLKRHPVKLIFYLEGGWGRRQDIFAIQRL